MQLQLEATLTRLLADYRNPARPPFSPAPLIQALDAAMPAAGQQFAGNAQACAMEFVAGVLGAVRVVHGHLVRYVQEGRCPTCTTVYRQVRTLSTENPNQSHMPSDAP